MTLHAGDREPSAPLSKTSRPSRGQTIASLVLVALIAIGYLVFVREYCSPYAGGADSSGYLNVARLIADGALVTPIPQIDGLVPPTWDYYYQQPLGFQVRSSTGTMVPTYSVVFPLHLVLAGYVVGIDYATILANSVLVVFGAALMVGVARHFGMPWAWSFAAAGLLWACPLFAMYAIQPMSDLPATVWVLASVWSSLKARDRWVWGFVAGLAVAISVLVRPSNALVVAPVAIILGWRWRAWLALVASGLPGALFLAWYNRTLYGAVAETGYGSVGALFSLAHVPHNARHFAIWIFLLLSPVVPLGALVLPWLRGRGSLFTWVAAAWFGVFTGFYVAYFHSGETWWYLRFILPAFPAVILAGVVASYHLTKHVSNAGVRCWLSLGLLVFAFGWEIQMARRLHIQLIKQDDMPYALTADWMKSNVPADAILLQMQLSGAFTYYTKFTVVRWDMLNPTTHWPALQKAARAAGRPLYATLFEFEEERAFRDHTPGRWELVARVRRVNVWRLAEAQENAE